MSFVVILAVLSQQFVEEPSDLGLPTIRRDEPSVEQPAQQERGGLAPYYADLFERDAEAQAALKEASLARLKRDVEIYAERRGAIRASAWISYFIFVVTHGLLGLAVWAAAREFQQAARLRQRPTEANELRLALDGISLKTSLHGTFLLALAIGFYLIYIKYVYPATAVG